MRKPIWPERDHDFLVVAHQEFRGIDLEKVEFAHALAVRAHEGQSLRQNGDLYIKHPERVARLAIDFRLPVESVALSLLHDIFEDSKHLSVEDVGDIRDILGVDVLFDLHTLSKRYANTQHEPPGHAESNYIRTLRRATRRAQIVKMLDRFDNLSDIEEDYIGDSKRARVKQTTREYFVPLAIVLLGNMNRTDEHRHVVEFLLGEFRRLSKI